MTNSPPASAERRGGWPSQFPAGRVFLVLFVVPIVAPILMFLDTDLSAKDGYSFANLRLVPLVAFAYGWPGYVAFLILGVPMLYVLFRRNWSEPLIFILIGALHTSIPWLVLGLRKPFSLSEYLADLKYEMTLFAMIGLFNGLLTRLIVLGRRL